MVDIIAKMLLAGNTCNTCKYSKRFIFKNRPGFVTTGAIDGCHNPRHKIYGKTCVPLPEEKICERWKADD